MAAAYTSRLRFESCAFDANAIAPDWEDGASMLARVSDPRERFAPGLEEVTGALAAAYAGGGAIVIGEGRRIPAAWENSLACAEWDPTEYR